MAPEITSRNSESDEGPAEPICERCRGAGFLRVDVDRDHPDFGKGKVVRCPACSEEREKRRLARVAERISADCGLDARQRGWSFENFEVYPGNEKAYEAAKGFAARGVDMGGWLVIRGGTTGTGKTHLLCAIANVVMSRGIPTLYAYTTDLLDHLRAGYRRKAEAEDDELGDFDERFERAKGVQLLLLDDFGVQVNTAWARERMEALIDARYRAGLPLVMTTNLDNKALQAISGRILDRLDRQEPARVVEMRAIKYRLWKRQQQALASVEEIPF